MDIKKAKSYLPTSAFSSGSLFKGSSVEYSSYKRHTVSFRCLAYGEYPYMLTSIVSDMLFCRQFLPLDATHRAKGDVTASIQGPGAYGNASL